MTGILQPECKVRFLLLHVKDSVFKGKRARIHDMTTFQHHWDPICNSCQSHNSHFPRVSWLSSTQWELEWQSVATVILPNESVYVDRWACLCCVLSGIVFWRISTALQDWTSLQKHIPGAKYVKKHETHTIICNIGESVHFTWKTVPFLCN